MKASTLFALILAVLLGLGAAVGAKYTGLLGRTETKKEPPPIMVLAAAGNIFEGNVIQAADVRLRPAHAEEMEAIRKGELLPPMIPAAVKRFAKINIPADAPMRKEFLEDLMAPTDLRARLAPGMRAVNLAIPKHHAAGGMINVGDWVDVQLMAAVEAPGVPLAGGAVAAGGTTAHAAMIARGVRIAAKRNNLWPVNTPLGPDCPVNFTLETNPYRSALIEFAKDKGTLVLLPVSEADKRSLEARRSDSLLQQQQNGNVVTASYVLQDNAEYQEEDVRVSNFLQGKYVIGENDLARIFNLKYTPPEAPPEPKKMMRITGIRSTGYHVLDGDRESFEAPVASGNNGPRRIAPANYTSNGVATAATSDATPFRFRPPEANCGTGNSLAIPTRKH